MIRVVILTLLLSGCTFTGCEGLDMHDQDLVSPEDVAFAGDCYRSYPFDWVLGHKLPGEH